MAHSALPRGAGLWLLLTLCTPLATAAEVDTQRFVEQVVTANLAANEAAEMALRTSDSADIKDFAQDVVADHPRNNADLETFARERQLQLPSDEQLQQNAKEEVKQLDGDDFDARFAELQVRSYEQRVELFSQAAEKGDTELQSFARTKLPVLKAQLQTARLLTRAHR
ncbi:MAG TPA: DUF4142 domain-containing protein [Pseudomonas sp.]|nr:DUF4142 domain-containing protein [Pseudomonas sp.]